MTPEQEEKEQKELTIGSLKEMSKK